MSDDLALIERELRDLPFDADFPIALVAIDNVISVLRRYMSGLITEERVEQWAELIECRDDIDFAPPDQSMLRHVIQRLANPVLFGNLNDDAARALVLELERVS